MAGRQGSILQGGVGAASARQPTACFSWIAAADARRRHNARPNGRWAMHAARAMPWLHAGPWHGRPACRRPGRLAAAWGRDASRAGPKWQRFWRRRRLRRRHWGERWCMRRRHRGWRLQRWLRRRLWRWLRRLQRLQRGLLGSTADDARRLHHDERGRWWHATWHVSADVCCDADGAKLVGAAGNWWHDAGWSATPAAGSAAARAAAGHGFRTAAHDGAGHAADDGAGLHASRARAERRSNGHGRGNAEVWRAPRANDGDAGHDGPRRPIRHVAGYAARRLHAHAGPRPNGADYARRQPGRRPAAAAAAHDAAAAAAAHSTVAT
mmetsp:Transcript_28892/g.83717  ORF Transcript_28892/g.83717 Transcript_28892/m.83717 type:complete len:324 (-) Transcript_28892:805-1776(-)